MNDPHALAGNADRFRDLQRVVIHQDDVRCFDGGVRSERAHGDADVRPREDRRVVNSVADKSELLLCRLLRFEQLFDLRDLIGRQKFAVDLRNAELAADGFRSRSAIAGQHDLPGHAGFLHLPDRFRRSLFDHV